MVFSIIPSMFLAVFPRRLAGAMVARQTSILKSGGCGFESRVVSSFEICPFLPFQV